VFLIFLVSDTMIYIKNDKYHIFKGY